MDINKRALAAQIVLWGAFFGLLLFNSAVVGMTVAVLFVAIGLFGKPTSEYAVYE